MIGQKLRQFLLEEKIGAGAMGIVYRATDERTRRTAAVKVITGEQGARAKAPQRFIREAEILQQFRHPNIVRFLGGGRFQGTLYLAMEFIPGGTLEDLIRNREFLPWREAVELGVQICDALHYAHERNVIHRDLKPSNLLITADGQVKLTDFGIAKDLDATALTADGRTLGTAAYMAPEQIRGNPEISHRTDLYAFGCVLYQMLTGQPPFEGKTAVSLMHAHLSEDPPRPSVKNPQIPLALDNLVISLMAKDPSARPFDAAAVSHILSQLQSKVAQNIPVAMVFPGTGQPSRLGAPVAGDRPPTTGDRRRKKGKAAAARASLADHPWLGSALLGGAAVVVLAVIVYELLPPGPEYLFRHAAAQMASPKSVDWLLAKTHYIDPLTQRFPEYRKADVQAWLDRIALDKAERRAYILEHPSMLASTRPQNDGEDLYLQSYKYGEDAKAAGLEPEAMKRWRTAARDLKALPDARGWALLAESRAAALEKTVATRRKDAHEQLALADTAEKAGRNDEATRIRRKVVADYGRYADLNDLLSPIKAALPKEESPAPKDGDDKPKAEPPG